MIDMGSTLLKVSLTRSSGESAGRDHQLSAFGPPGERAGARELRSSASNSPIRERPRSQGFRMAAGGWL